jgi:uncharacterized membrane-anchored protein YhcB (DUF1043 family)
LTKEGIFRAVVLIIGVIVSFIALKYLKMSKTTKQIKESQMTTMTQNSEGNMNKKIMYYLSSAHGRKQ